MDVSKMSELVNRAKLILQNEGLISILRGASTFVIRNLAKYFFRYRIYYLYEFATENVHNLNEADFTPKIDNITLKIISTNDEANELENEGLKFRSQPVKNRNRLDKGAIAFCILIERELANIGWVAMTQQAKDALNELPYRVDFSKSEACSGDAWTNPKFRRMGLRKYSLF